MNSFPKRRSLRKPGLKYTDPGYYFITACSHKREFLFGEIINGVMQVNRFGEIVQRCWEELPVHYSRLKLDAFVVMPNHIHGILVLEDFHQYDRKFQTIDSRNNITEIVRALKSFSAREINKIRQTPGEPVWQRTFYDRVIRTNKALGLMRLYITTNPLCWSFDHDNTDIWIKDEEIKKQFIVTGIFQKEDLEIIRNYIEFRQIKSGGS